MSYLVRAFSHGVRPTHKINSSIYSFIILFIILIWCEEIVLYLCMVYWVLPWTVCDATVVYVSQALDVFVYQLAGCLWVLMLFFLGRAGGTTLYPVWWLFRLVSSLLHSCKTENPVLSLFSTSPFFPYFPLFSFMASSIQSDSSIQRPTSPSSPPSPHPVLTFTLPLLLLSHPASLCTQRQTQWTWTHDRNHTLDSGELSLGPLVGGVSTAAG